MSFLRRFRRKSGSGSRDSSVHRDESSCNSSRRNSSVLSNSSDSREGSMTKTSKKNRLFSKLSNSLSSSKDKDLKKSRSSDGDFHINPYNTYQKNAQPDPIQDDPDPFGVLYDKQIIKSDPQYTSTYKTRKSIHSLTPPNDMDFPKENEEDKYKTVTLSSYRKYFRDKYLNDQNKQPQHNPSWFVEVDKKPDREKDREKVIHESPQEVLIFENDNYRRNSRSPLRHSRSPVRRTDTFRVTEPSTQTIRIQIRNSPQKMVPVGVAKPMVTSAWNKTTTVHTQYQPRSTSAAKPVQQQRAPYQTRIQIKPTSILVSPSPKVKSVTHFGDHVARPNLVARPNITATSERLSRPNMRVPPNNNRVKVRIPSKSPIKVPWR